MITLRSYQKDIATKACALLQQYKIAYLSMQVRTGKTLTAMKAAQHYGANRVLFLTKKKAMSSIKEDYEKFIPCFHIEIINYEQLHRISGEKFDFIICDEAHVLGQFPQASNRTIQLKLIAKDKPIIFLSGTPSPESYSQLYHQFWVSSYSPFAAYSNFYSWAKEFVRKKKRYFYNREVVDYSDAYVDEIHLLAGHLFISYSQAEAGFIQDVQEQVLQVPMKRNTYRLADILTKERIYISENGEEIIADTELKLMQKLHQLYSGTVIVDNKAAAIQIDNSKALFIKHYFEGKKIAIFYKFRAEQQILTQVFDNTITTDPDEFNHSTDKIFISQIQSGREGINLSTADALVMFNIDFSSLSYQQARARIQCKDRTEPCLLYWVFAENGIEEKIYKVVMNKQDYTLTYFKKDFATFKYLQL